MRLSLHIATITPTMLYDNFEKYHELRWHSVQGGVSYDTDIMEVSVDITIPECTPGLPKYDYVPYQSNAWVGMSAFSTTDEPGLLQTGEYRPVKCLACL